MSAFFGASPTQKPMLAISVKLSPRARKYVMTSKRSGTGANQARSCASRLALRVCSAVILNLKEVAISSRQCTGAYVTRWTWHFELLPRQR